MTHIIDEVLGEFIRDWHQIEDHSKDTSAYDGARAKLLAAIQSVKPEHMTYGENLNPRVRQTQKYTKEKTGEVTGFNRALNQYTQAIEELFK